MTIVVWPWNERPWKLAEKGRDDVSRKHYIPGNLQVFVRKYFKKEKHFTKRWQFDSFSSHSSRQNFANALVEIRKIQGDPNQNLQFKMAITLKIRISDPKLVKPKCVLEASIYFHFSAVCLQFSAVCLQFWKINAGFLNTFWLYWYGVRNVYFPSYSHLN